jgi:hypothetical protein
VNTCALFHISLVSFTPLPLYHRGKCSRYLLDRRLGGPQSRYGRCSELKILDPSRTRTPTRWSSSPWPVAILTALPRLLQNTIIIIIQLFIINVPSQQQNAIYRNSTVNICMYISVLQHNIWLEHVMYRARIKNK